MRDKTPNTCPACKKEHAFSVVEPEEFPAYLFPVDALEGKPGRIYVCEKTGFVLTDEEGELYKGPKLEEPQEVATVESLIEAETAPKYLVRWTENEDEAARMFGSKGQAEAFVKELIQRSDKAAGVKITRVGK